MLSTKKTNKSGEEKNEPKRERPVGRCYLDSSDSGDEDTSEGDHPGNVFVHVSEIDFSIFP